MNFEKSKGVFEAPENKAQPKCTVTKSGPEVIKLFFMLNSAEQENSSANEYESPSPVLHLLSPYFEASAWSSGLRS